MKFYTSLFRTEVVKVDDENDYSNLDFVDAGTVFQIDRISGFGIHLKTICGKYEFNGGMQADLLNLAFKENNFVEQKAALKIVSEKGD